MKLVIKIGGACLKDTLIVHNFTKTVSELLSEGHRIIIVHSGVCTGSKATQNGSKNVPSFVSDKNEMPTLLGSWTNRSLVASLAKGGISSIGLWGSDGNTIRTKVSRSDQHQNGSALRVAAVEPFWLDVITENRGVPVIANVAAGPDGQYGYICADELAATCAIAWRADTLILLTRAQGILDNNGTVIRWLDTDLIVSDSHNIQKPSALSSRLVACYNALHQGVHRVRVFPVSQIHSLSLFCRERIDFGTEIIHSSAATRR